MNMKHFKMFSIIINLVSIDRFRTHPTPHCKFLWIYIWVVGNHAPEDYNGGIYSYCKISLFVALT